MSVSKRWIDLSSSTGGEASVEEFLKINRCDAMLGEYPRLSSTYYIPRALSNCEMSHPPIPTGLAHPS